MSRLLQAPHRVFFFAAVIALLASSAWWAAVLALRAAGIAPPLAEGLVPGWVHGLLMIYGFFPLFIFGFLFTAGPKWLDRPAPQPREYVPPALFALAAGWALVPALLLARELAVIAAVAYASVWAWLLLRFLRLIRESTAPDRMHAKVAAASLAMGLAGLGCAIAWLATGSRTALAISETAGLWGFLVPLFCTVSHRMIPFFTTNVMPFVMPWRPTWTLVALLAASLVHGALCAFGLANRTWIVDAPAAAMVFFMAYRWCFARTFANRLLAMLHVGFVWLGIAWLLAAVQSIAAAAGQSILGLAPIHAFTAGFIGSLTLAMVSRVSRGHSGRPLAADRLTWVVFWLLQFAVIARLAADLWLARHGALVVAAALMWIACFGAWAWRYIPFYWLPRADGRPG